MDAKRLAEIDARCLAATPGPWEWCVQDRFGQEYEMGYVDSAKGVVLEPTIAGDADAVFIAHAREDVPALLKALAASREYARALALAVKSVVVRTEQAHDESMRQERERCLAWLRYGFDESATEESIIRWLAGDTWPPSDDDDESEAG
jgi:hypothetical protein